LLGWTLPICERLGERLYRARIEEKLQRPPEK
jgi:hypothetical protein